ncbi:MAG: hypothetical protein B7Z37_21035 [Verrucomicrobia bacterium 12-59-8]|nr:MAG: hypothetical protein B7Z37_21035 [Verrucomicrobia bacterium 12-59-8]
MHHCRDWPTWRFGPASSSLASTASNSVHASRNGMIFSRSPSGVSVTDCARVSAPVSVRYKLLQSSRLVSSSMENGQIPSAARRRTFRHCLPLLGLFGAAFAPPGQAATVSVSYDAPLRFGKFVVPVSGSRTVSTTGAVTDNGVYPIVSSTTGPAQFTVTYDRGNESSLPLTVLLQVQITGQAASSGSVTGTISSFSTDIPGVLGLLPGSLASLTLTNCRTRRCATSVRVGGQLQVTRTSGGAELTVPILVTASVIAAF